MADTAQKICEKALRLNGVHNPSPGQLKDTLEALNDMIVLWGISKLMVYAITSESFTLVIGQNTYTFGTGGDFDSDRPSKVTDSYIRDAQSTDHPVNTTMTKEEWNSVINKGSSARPDRLAYVNEYPLGKVYMDFTPDAAETIFIDSWKPISEFASLSTSFAFPAEYRVGLKFNLAVHISGEFDNILLPTTVAIAKESLRTIKSLNVHPVETLKAERDITWSLQR